MDILKKMFQKNDKESDSKRDNAKSKGEFRNPEWFEQIQPEDESFDDDRKFVFQIFTNPIDVQKHFEKQIQQFLESFDIDENASDAIEKNLKEEFLKSDSENVLLNELKKKRKERFDTDLDGEIFSDQLHSLIQRFVNDAESLKELPQITHDYPDGNILPSNDKKGARPKIPKMTDEEIIMGRIHGTLDRENQMNHQRFPGTSTLPRYRPDLVTPLSPIVPRSNSPFSGSTFDGTLPGPKMFSQSVITKTVRKPDGTYETTKVVQDSQGNKTTTITRKKNGKTETTTTYNGNGNHETESIKSKELSTNESTPQQQETLKNEMNYYVSKEGYALPRNLW